MKVNVKEVKFVEVDLKPGDKVEVDWMYKGCRKILCIKRIVETKYHTYAVLSNSTWRPISSYGYTWRKVND
jgi:hypothetical protein